MRRILLPVLAIFLFLGSALQARADGDRVSFLHDITISSDEDVNDTVCFLCSIHISGPVHKDAVAFLGSIRANAPIEGDAVVFLGNISLGEEGRVGKDCVAFLGSVTQHGSNQVGHDLVQFPMGLIVIPIFIFFVLIYIVRSLVRRAYAPYPMPPPPPMR